MKHKIAYHGIGLYAHDIVGVNTFFNYGFGFRCMDAIRHMIEIECDPCIGIDFEELMKSDVNKIRELRKMHSEHMGSSPCFIHSSLDEFNTWLERAEKRDSRIFVAKDRNHVIAYMEVIQDGENFVTEEERMSNICGAFCLPSYRGKNIFQNLVNHTIRTLKVEGYSRLGVDFESFNPTAYGFWLKYFTAYTNSVVRRIDECGL